MLNLKTNLKQINDKRTLVNLYKDIVLVTRLRIFCATLFYQQQHKSRDSNACLSVLSFANNYQNCLLINIIIKSKFCQLITYHIPPRKKY